MAKNKLFAEFPPVSPQQWEEAIKDSLKGVDISKIFWRTDEGFDVKPFYTKIDLEGLIDLTYYPNVYPYLRGYNDKKLLWQVIQNIDEIDLKTANEIAIKSTSNGADAVEFNIPNIDNKDDLSILFNNLDLANHSVHFSSSYSYSILAQIIKEWATENNFDLNLLKGSFNFDFFAYYLLNGSYYNSFDDNVNELTTLFNFLSNWNPNFKIININGDIYHNAGANAVQELAFSLAQMVNYLDILTDNGISIDQAIKRIRLTLGLGSTYFIEIAKLRAARLLISKVLTAYELSKDKTKICIHSKTGIFNKTAYDVYNNMLRNTVEAMSAIIGGADEITILPHDITLHKSNDFSRRIARNVQLILRDEAHFDNVIDPAGGSYLIENLTKSIAQHAWDLFCQIEDMGGFKDVMENSWIKNEIEKSAENKLNAILKRKSTVIGINNYPNMNETISAELHKPLINKPKNDNALKIFRVAEPFENLRYRTEMHVNNGNKKPLVYLLPFGDLAMRNARVNFSRNFFGVAGYEIMDAEVYNNDEMMIKLISEHNPDIIVLCSSDAEYGSLGINIAKTIKENYPNKIIVVAGNPTEIIELLKDNGVNEFIHVKSNILETLENFHKILNIK
jgi:methylmalonyl-CoA mutase